MPMVGSQLAHPHCDPFLGPACQHHLLTSSSWLQLSPVGKECPLSCAIGCSLLFSCSHSPRIGCGWPSPVFLSLGCLHAEIALTMGYPVPGCVLLIYLSGATVRFCLYRPFPPGHASGPACVAVWLSQSMSIIPSSQSSGSLG